MFDFSGKRALVTGGTRGLGRAIASELARAGASVALNYRRDDESAAKALEEIRAFSPNSCLVKADLEDEKEVRAMVAKAGRELGGLDIFVANAAATAFKPLLEVKAHNLTRTFNLSVGGFVAAVQEASRLMGNGGRIIMVSGMDSVRYLAGHGALGAAKAALESMVRYFAFELGPRGITVNGVNFALIDTASARFYLAAGWERARRTAAKRSALGRIARPEEIAAVVCFLASPAASFVTAQTIMVDGGLTLNLPLVP